MDSIKKRDELFSAGKQPVFQNIKNGEVRPAAAIPGFGNNIEHIGNEEYFHHLASIVESSDDAIISKSLDGIIKSWNKGAEKMFGYMAEQAIGKHISIIIPNEYLKEEKQILEKIRNNEIINHYETVRNKKNGEQFYVSLTVSPLKDDKGNIIGTSKIARDISFQKKSEAAFILANNELAFQNKEKEKRAAELIVANKELAFQNEEKEKRAAELVIANKELAFQNEEKEKRAAELIIANKELAFQNEEKEKRAAEYRQIVETAQEGIWLIDENSITIFVNQKMCEILEYPQEEMLGRKNYYFMDDAGKEMALITLEKRRKGIKEDVEMYLITKTGRNICVCISANPIFEEGEYKGALGMVSDITGKKNLENLLDKANKLARMGSWEIDVIKNSFFWSAITKEILEVDPDFVPGLESGRNYFREGYDRETISRRLKECMEKGTPWDEELQIITKKGNLKWIRTIGEAKFINGVCIKIYGSFQDINTRKNSEIEILKAFEEKNIILESIGDAFFAVDKNWVVTYWNHHAEKILYGPKTEIIGKNLWEIFSNSVDSESYKKYHQAAESNQVIHFEDYYEPLHKWYEISAYPSLNGLSVYFKDITEKNILQQQLLEEQLNNQKEITKAVVNAQENERAEIGKELHDNINQLLAASKLYLSHSISKPVIIKKDVLQCREYIISAMDEIRKLSHVLVGPAQDQTIGLVDSLQELISDMSILKDLKINFNSNDYHEEKSEPELKLVIFRIIQGQLSNILKHADATEIDIELNKEGNDLVVVINDNGKGFDTSAKVKGIGLQNIRNRAEVHNGVVKIVSSPGNGCRMKITFKDHDPVDLQ